MKYGALLIFGFFMLTACAAPQVQAPPADNPRIIYRDLTKPNPVKNNISKNETGAGDAASAAYNSNGAKPRFFIQFANESTQKFDPVSFKKLLGATHAKTHILVVGHSYGKSAVGTMNLAAKRAQTIARQLSKRGYANVYAMASWGRTPVWFAPSRGVSIYVIEKNPTDTVPIIFKGNSPVKKPGGPKGNVEVAAPVPKTGADGA